MSSILTNMSAMSAVANLNMTQKSLSETQNQISTGMRVGSAKDNVAYWSIATSMRSQTKELSAVSDALNLGTSVLGTATAALDSTISLVQKLQSDLVSAQQAGVDANKVQTDIKAIQSQLSSTIKSAAFNNVNLLDASSTTATQQSIVSAVNGVGTSNFSVSKINIAYSDTQLLTTDGATGSGILDKAGAAYTGASILTFNISTATSGDLTNISKDLDTALASIQTVAAKIGAAQTNVGLQTTFVSALSDAITTGIGSLVDADMNAASTRLNALQTQQQLGIQALSIANQNSQIILKLFNG